MSLTIETEIMSNGSELFVDKSQIYFNVNYMGNYRDYLKWRVYRVIYEEMMLMWQGLGYEEMLSQLTTGIVDYVRLKIWLHTESLGKARRRGQIGWY